jgi:RimJ/RimL family protein N-acetyltransferase
MKTVMPSRTTSEPLTLRLLQGQDPGQAAALEGVLLGAPGYRLVCEGRLPIPEDVQELLTDRPPGSFPEQKHVYGILLGEQLIGCIDAIRGWPEPDVCFIGLLLLSEAYQKRGLGRRAFQALVEQVSRWPEIRRLALAVIATNAGAARFWRSLGFVETGERRQSERYTGEVVRLARALATPWRVA